ncbi:MAG: tetratricopeptide repeat protein [Acidobacteria bacterium]|nr:tetratricopeptide repeat protein [Acidobacteriota bacterium]
MKKAAVAPTALPPVDWGARITAADALYARGHYTALKDARDLYEEALAIPGRRAAVTEKFVRSAVALDLREKELGILPGKPAQDLAAFVAADPALDTYASWLELLSGLPNKIKGSPGIEQTGGRSLEALSDWARARVPDLDKKLEERDRTDDLAAALRLAMRATYFYKFQDKIAPKSVLDLHPGSRLVAFQAAVSPSIEPDQLEALLTLEPEFSEIHYYLGEVALLGGKLLTAERHYLTVHGKIPESLSVLISLAKVAFQMEEIESCLEYNEKALTLLPTYRDALLGKGLCLGYLGRKEEAVAVLERLLELGTYYIGEAYYWTAWNLNELGRLEEARRAVESAKVRLVGVSDVAGLSGIVAYRQGRLGDAEKDLREALDIEPSDSDAAFYLGKLYADLKDWMNSGIYFAGAALSLEDKERSMEKKIEEIEASEMPPERKSRLVVKKKVQILSVQATKATCQYNGAAGFHNAGAFERALDLARLAAAHPAFAEKAAELLKLIRDRQGAESLERPAEVRRSGSEPHFWEIS